MIRKIGSTYDRSFRLHTYSFHLNYTSDDDELYNRNEHLVDLIMVLDLKIGKPAEILLPYWQVLFLKVVVLFL